jgi:hypothetical protein
LEAEIASLPVLSARLKCDVTKHELKAFVRVAPGESMLRVAYRRWRRLLDELWFEVCARWRDFRAFIMDVGLPEKADAVLGRVDVLESLRPGNARWIAAEHRMAQAWAGALARRRTRRFAPDDPLMTLNELGDRYGVSHGKVNRRRFSTAAGGYTNRQVFGLDPLPMKDPRNPPRAPRKPYVKKEPEPPRPVQPVRRRDDWIGQLAVEF